MTNQTPSPFAQLPVRTNDYRCPQCNRLLLADEIPHNACAPCQKTIGRVLQLQPGAPLTFLKTTPQNETAIEGESHD
jgi:hypothetical protein